MKIKDIAEVIERYAPLRLQESYDNAGLIVGRPEDEVHKALLAVDVTEEVLDEAEQTGCDLIITHHPIVFHALKRFNSASYVERCVERAIRRGIALYACHTNLDSAPGGMSWRLAEMLGVEELRVLQPTDPADGRVGFGVVGELPQSMSVRDFMHRIQERLSVQVIRHSELVREQVRRARRAQADVYVTSDLKYNDFMTPDGAFVVADIGHFESEYCAIDILFDILSKNLFTFAVRKSVNSRNPIGYIVPSKQ